MPTAAIANILVDYRENEIERVTEEHVDRWIQQFPTEKRNLMLSELAHVFGKTYFSRQRCNQFLHGIVRNDRLTGGDPQQFWRRTALLNIQTRGRSQHDMIENFSSVLRLEFGNDFRTAQAQNAGGFLYLDDGIFSGSRAKGDLVAWIRGLALREFRLDVVVFVSHSLGEYYLTRDIQSVERELGKRIHLNIWAVKRYENKLIRRNSSDVLWPSLVPDDPVVQEYVQGIENRVVLREGAGQGEAAIFSSDEGRRVLEEQFIIAGAKIAKSCGQIKKCMRPLGFYNFGLGFGTMFATFRNCPNNAPIAIWWGVPTRMAERNWVPLLRRLGNDDV